MNVVVLPNTLEQGISPFAASARLRAEVVVKYLNRQPGFVAKLAHEAMSDITEWIGADVVIFQKYFEDPRALELARQLYQRKVKVVLDLCDANWIWAKKLAPLQALLQLCHAAIGSSPPITTWLSQFCPSFTVSDGIDTEGLPLPKQHTDHSPLKLVWFGNRSNWPLIGTRIAYAKSLAPGVELVTISDHPSASVPWKLNTVNAEIQKCDIFWHPRGFGLEQEVKTNNKEQLAWALGLPVITDQGLAYGLAQFKTAIQRNKEAEYRCAYVRDYYAMSKVIKQWSAVLLAVSRLPS